MDTLPTITLPFTVSGITRIGPMMAGSALIEWGARVTFMGRDPMGITFLMAGEKTPAPERFAERLIWRAMASLEVAQRLTDDLRAGVQKTTENPLENTPENTPENLI